MTNTSPTTQTLVIGVFMHPWTKAYGIYAQQQFKEQADTDTVLAYYSYKRDLTQALLNGSIHIVCTSLRELPTELPKGIVIGALSSRFPVSSCLVVSPQAVDTTQLFSLKLNAQVKVNSNINKAQLAAFRPDLSIQISDDNPLDCYKKMADGEFDACLLTTSLIQALNIDENTHTIITFNPKELVPEVGQGVAAYLVSESDLTTRRLLKSLHHPSVSQVTNVERKVKKLFNDNDIAAYCEKDKLGNFHLSAAAIINNELKTIRLSQSTNFDLAENCKNNLG